MVKEASALFDKMLDLWIEKVKADPSADLGVFVDCFPLSDEQKNEIQLLLVNVSPLKNCFDVKMRPEFEANLFEDIKKRFKEVFPPKEKAAVWIGDMGRDKSVRNLPFW